MESLLSNNKKLQQKKTQNNAKLDLNEISLISPPFTPTKVQRSNNKPKQLHFNKQAQDYNLVTIPQQTNQNQTNDIFNILSTMHAQQQSSVEQQQFVLSPLDFVSDQLFESITKTTPASSLFMSSPILSPFMMITPPTSPTTQQQPKFDTYFTNVINNHDNNDGTSVSNIMSASEDLLSPGMFMEFNDISDNFLRDGWHHHEHPPSVAKVAAKPPKLTLPKKDISEEIVAKKISTTTISTAASTKTEARKKQSKAAATKKKSSVPVQPTTSNSARSWTTVFVDKQFENQIEVELSSKTRCEEPSAEVPTKMYSSLKYEIRQHATGPLCDQVQFILSKITVVDSVTFEEIKKDTKPVLKGVVEAALTKPPGVDSTSKLYGVLKSQFTDVSYHHKKRDFCWQISLFRPDDLLNPIMIKRSAPYQVFARKPATGTKKRKRETSSDDEALGKFQGSLDQLLQDAKRMKTDDKKKAMELICAKIIEFDSKFFVNKMTELQQMDEAQD